METNPSDTSLLLSNERLEKHPIKFSIVPILRKIVQRLIETFIGSNDLQIGQTYDRFGNKWWHVYDPVTGRHASVDSEEQLRAWIEERYYN